MSGWKSAELLKHFIIQLLASVDKQIYSQMNIRCRKQNSCKINVVKDTGVQSCLWDFNSYLKYRFKTSDLLPFKINAVNKEHIQITDGIFIEFMSKDVLGKRQTVNVMVYISPFTNKFYISRDACIKLDIINIIFSASYGCGHQS